MDITFVENAEHDVHGEEREGDEEALVLERVLERLRGALERPANAGGQFNLSLGLRDCVNRIAKRDSRREIERDRHTRELTRVIDGERGHIVREVGEGTELD